MIALLVAWWIVHPIVQRWVGHYGAVHMLWVAAVALVGAWGLWRRPTVRLGVPGLCTAAALVSLALATVVAEPGRFPRSVQWWGAMTGLAHATFFLVMLGWAPARGEHPDDVAHRLEPDVQRARSTRRLLALLLVGLVAVQAGFVATQLDGPERPAGTLGNPNILGAVVVAAGLATAAAGRWRPSMMVPLAGFVVVLLLTRSRGALAAGSAVMLLLAARRSWLTVAAVGGGLVALLVLVPNPLWERILALRSEHHYGRLFFWEVALRNIAEHPLGIGVGCNRFVFPPLALDADFPWLLHQRHHVGLTHNVLLTVALEWGWLAGASALVLLAWAARRITPRHKERDALLQAAAVGAGVLFLEAQWDGLEQNTHAFSLLLFLGALAVSRAGGPAWGLRLSGRLVALLALSTALFLVDQAVERMGRQTALAEARQAVAAWRDGQLDEGSTRRALEAAAARAPQDAEPFAERFAFESSLARRLGTAEALDEPALVEALAAAQLAIDQARQRDPASPGLVRQAADWTLAVWRRSGKDPRLLGRYMQEMEQLLVLDPLDLEARWELAREAQRVGDMDRFEHHLARLFHYEPDDALAWYSLAIFRQLEGRKEEALYAWLRTQEALFNCRTKLSIDSPDSQAYYQRRIDGVDLERVRRAIATLRKELYG